MALRVVAHHQTKLLMLRSAVQANNVEQGVLAQVFNQGVTVGQRSCHNSMTHMSA